MSKVKLGEVAREYKVNVKAQTGKEKLVRTFRPRSCTVTDRRCNQ